MDMILSLLDANGLFSQLGLWQKGQWVLVTCRLYFEMVPWDLETPLPMRQIILSKIFNLPEAQFSCRWNGVNSTYIVCSPEG